MRGGSGRIVGILEVYFVGVAVKADNRVVVKGRVVANDQYAGSAELGNLGDDVVADYVEGCNAGSVNGVVDGESVGNVSYIAVFAVLDVVERNGGRSLVRVGVGQTLGKSIAESVEVLVELGIVLGDGTDQLEGNGIADAVVSNIVVALAVVERDLGAVLLGVDGLAGVVNVVGVFLYLLLNLGNGSLDHDVNLAVRCHLQDDGVGHAAGGSVLKEVVARFGNGVAVLVGTAELYSGIAVCAVGESLCDIAVVFVVGKNSCNIVGSIAVSKNVDAAYLEVAACSELVEEVVSLAGCSEHATPLNISEVLILNACCGEDLICVEIMRKNFSFGLAVRREGGHGGKHKDRNSHYDPGDFLGHFHFFTFLS